MILSIILAVVGFSLIICKKQIGNAMYKVQLPAFRLLAPKIVEKPWFIKGYRLAAILMGIFLLLFAYANAYGPSSF